MKLTYIHSQPKLCPKPTPPLNLLWPSMCTLILGWESFTESPVQGLDSWCPRPQQRAFFRRAAPPLAILWLSNCTQTSLVITSRSALSSLEVYSNTEAHNKKMRVKILKFVLSPFPCRISFSSISKVQGALGSVSLLRRRSPESKSKDFLQECFRKHQKQA